MSLAAAKLIDTYKPLKVYASFCKRVFVDPEVERECDHFITNGQQFSFLGLTIPLEQTLSKEKILQVLNLYQRFRIRCVGIHPGVLEFMRIIG
jgi:hypothetical protein